MPKAPTHVVNGQMAVYWQTSFSDAAREQQGLQDNTQTLWEQRSMLLNSCQTSELGNSRQSLLSSWLLFPHPFVTPSVLVFSELLPRELQQPHWPWHCLCRGSCLPRSAMHKCSTEPSHWYRGMDLIQTCWICTFTSHFSLFRGWFLFHIENSSIRSTVFDHDIFFQDTDILKCLCTFAKWYFCLFLQKLLGFKASATGLHFQYIDHNHLLAQKLRTKSEPTLSSQT